MTKPVVKQVVQGVWLQDSCGESSRRFDVFGDIQIAPKKEAVDMLFYL